MYLGIDFGTSGCRASVIDQHQQPIAEVSIPLPAPERIQGRIQQQPELWLEGLRGLFAALSQKLELRQIKRLAIDGTSGSVLLCDQQGRLLTPALMYNDASSRLAVDIIRQHCPDPQHITLSAGSGLAKALQLSQSLDDALDDEGFIMLNQADYLSNHLADVWGVSDYHNALKLGYDVENLRWPQWIKRCVPAGSLPRVVSPGQVFANVDPQMAQRYGLAVDCQICSGTTDANAAFIATQSSQLGDAVTSLGSTLVVKILNDKPIQDLATGVYSHKLGRYWLTGGASNAGAAILRRYFSDQQLEDYSKLIDIDHPTGLAYYPLPSAGERFPVADPHKQPVVTPRPASDTVFLQALLEGLTNIEKSAYQKLTELGARQPRRILTSGGGAGNRQWTRMRQRMLAVTVQPAQHTAASYGSALLALQGLQPYAD